MVHNEWVVIRTFLTIPRSATRHAHANPNAEIAADAANAADAVRYSEFPPFIISSCIQQPLLHQAWQHLIRGSYPVLFSECCAPEDPLSSIYYLFMNVSYNLSPASYFTSPHLIISNIYLNHNIFIYHAHYNFYLFALFILFIYCALLDIFALIVTDIRLLLLITWMGSLILSAVSGYHLK